MEFLIRLNKSIFFIVLAVLLLNSCKENVAPDYKNILDPDAVSFQGQSPTNLKITILSQNAIKLEWQNNSNYENGYIIERTLINDSNYVKIGEVGHNITSFIDNAPVSNSYLYRVRMKNTITNNTSDIITEPYTEKIKLADNVDNFCLSPNGQYVAAHINGMITVFNTSDGTKLSSISYNTEVFCLSNDYIATAINTTKNQTIKIVNIKLWRISDGTLITSFFDETNYNVYEPLTQSSSLVFNMKGNILISFYGSTINVWNLENILSPIIQKSIGGLHFQDSVFMGYFELSGDEKYLIARDNNSQIIVYDTETWNVIYSVNGDGSVLPHLINQDIVFYYKNSLNFYDFKNKSLAVTIKDFNYGSGVYNVQYKVNINSIGSILSAYHDWEIIDLWLLGSDYKLIKKLKSINMNDGSANVCAFSTRNDFFVLTSFDRLYLFKYY